MLLRFLVANHKSIRHPQELSLVAVPVRGAPKPRASEIPPVLRVTGIYGANAAGKSNVLDALRWARNAIATSHTGWAPAGGIPRVPFALDEVAHARPTECELDFVFEGIRYTYGFEVDDEVVRREWLLSFPAGRPVRLFDRAGPEKYSFGRALTGEKDQIRRLTRPNSLYLSSAASNNHETLGAIHRWLTNHFLFAGQETSDEVARLGTTYRLLDDKGQRASVGRLMRLADLGISEVNILRDGLERSVEFLHHTDDGPGCRLAENQESAGSRAWLAMAGPLLIALQSGAALVVDEIDSSLHPMLSSTLIRVFKDPHVNRLGAQLLFASHDTTLLGGMLADETLARDEVWFAEKDRGGGTSLFSLAEFHPRKGENVERGYLQGRYGAVPYLKYDEIRDVFTDMWAREDQDAVR